MATEEGPHERERERVRLGLVAVRRRQAVLPGLRPFFELTSHKIRSFGSNFPGVACALGGFTP